MALILITGTLVQDAEVRTQPIGTEGTPMPVLCLLLNSDGPGQLPVKAEQVYPPHMRAQAEKIARKYKQGKRVSVTAPPEKIRTTLGHCTAFELLNETAPSIDQLQLLEAAHG
ncbi:hypothetical protein HMPREF9701_00355 [Delftia acidovorans CCUG 274B]|uniref:hypothetical protein n=1 Tax=Delftia acidovorans TaxID=80866 RepID=UPI00035460E7|nr:hypothetical protein [Delftia acidovorans]EPD44767.1 hypothetical protein HMPREF9701_00355 [Delftia acidovorans CCUG 274B]